MATMKYFANIGEGKKEEAQTTDPDVQLIPTGPQYAGLDR
jgi:hypothetical protein